METQSTPAGLLPRERVDRTRFVIFAQPVDAERPDYVRLRRFIKWLGRRAGLDVLEVRERTNQPHPAPCALDTSTRPRKTRRKPAPRPAEQA